MSAMMYEVNLSNVATNAEGKPAVNDFFNMPPEGPLKEYLRTYLTKYYYCWTEFGEIYPRAYPPKLQNSRDRAPGLLKYQSPPGPTAL